MRFRVRIASGLVPLFLIAGSLRADDGQTASDLIVMPPTLALSGSEARQQVAISIRNPDGSATDETRGAEYRIDPVDLASVSSLGVVRPRRDGSGFLHVRAGRREARIPIRVTGSAEPHRASYRHEVVALLAKAGCNMGACHGNQNGKGGFKLSLRGEDPGFDLLSLTRDTLGRRVDLSEPSRSLVYQKPSGLIAHEGGVRMAADDPESTSLLGWIAAGAIDDAATASRLAKLEVFPVERRVAGGLSQQLVVTARFDDGTSRDVTRACTYDSSDPTILEVSPDGLAVATTTAEASVAIRYLDGRAVSRLAFLPDRPDDRWTGPDPDSLTSPIDRAVMARLRDLRVNPSPRCSDAVFLRRASLDAIGTLPTVEEARAFLADNNPDRRTRLIDELIHRPEFADYWALKWADLLRNEEKGMGSKGVQVLRRWLRDQIDADMPMDQMAGELVSSLGSTWSVPAASFHRTNRTPEAAAEAVSQVFLGIRLQCARCHNHPFDSWTQADYYGLAAYFSSIDRKQVTNLRKDALDKHEINGDEIIYLTDQPARLRHPRTGDWLRPRPPRGPDAGQTDGRPALDDLAAWLSRANWQVSQNLANRVWFHLLGRGVVDPVDDFRASNPPSNPELLHELTRAIEEGEMTLRPLVRRIMTSDTYQLDSVPNPTNERDEIHFARYPVRPLPAEVLLDAIGQFLERPDSPRAIAQPGVQARKGAPGATFLQVFGKPDRLLTCECERSTDITLAQAFQLLNGPVARDAIGHPRNRLGRLLDAGKSDPEILEELYLASLSRQPTRGELDEALQHVRSRPDDRRRAWEDVAWALLNSKEFLLQH